MSDPSTLLPPPLLAHVHLLSAYKYPFAPTQLQLDTVLEYLSKAPALVRELAPVAWTYLGGGLPLDGSVLLVWRGGRCAGMCASDGYIWAEPELHFVNEVRGYTIEIHVHESGFTAPEQLATHRRVRYRLTSSPPGMPFDPALEIMHYSQASPEHRLPSRNIPLRQDMQKKLSERGWLERAGGLPRKDFMLHDVGNWPTLTFPGSQGGQAQAQGQNAGSHLAGFPNNVNIYAQQQQQQIQQQRQTNPNLQRAAASFARPSNMSNSSPSKRTRQLPPPRLPSGTSTSILGVPNVANAAELFESALADEEAAPLGDALDMLTPQEISVTRYTQHHEWMDAILGSVYGVAQIEPVSLDLQAGMAELVSALLGGDAVDQEEKKDMAALTARLNACLEEESETFKAMNAAHEVQLARHRDGAGAVYARLERQLAAISPANMRARGELERVTEEMKDKTGLEVVPREEIRCVKRGGLKDVWRPGQQGREIELMDLTMPSVAMGNDASPSLHEQDIQSQAQTQANHMHGSAPSSTGLSTHANADANAQPMGYLSEGSGRAVALQAYRQQQQSNLPPASQTHSRVQEQPQLRAQPQPQPQPQPSYSTPVSTMIPATQTSVNPSSPTRQVQHTHDPHAQPDSSEPENDDQGIDIDVDAFGEFLNHDDDDDNGDAEMGGMSGEQQHHDAGTANLHHNNNNGQPTSASSYPGPMSTSSLTQAAPSGVTFHAASNLLTSYANTASPEFGMSAVPAEGLIGANVKSDPSSSHTNLTTNTSNSMPENNNNNNASLHLHHTSQTNDVVAANTSASALTSAQALASTGSVAATTSLPGPVTTTQQSGEQDLLGEMMLDSAGDALDFYDDEIMGAEF